MMIDREKVIKAFEFCLMPSSEKEIEDDICSHEDCPYYREYNGGKCISAAVSDALALLKEHEKATIEPKRIDLPDETKAWLDKMNAVDALGNIADICMDWDGYRTANGLGWLINEIWAYARYCADRLQKAQEPIEPYTERDGRTTFFLCGSCNKPLCIAKESYKPKYCPECGRKVEWE